MKKIIVIIIFVIMLCLVFFYIYLYDNKIKFPSAPTQQERDDSKKLPKEKCGCWDGINNVCLPQEDCI